jgi:hypothetical protein
MLNIVYRPVSYLKDILPETGICLQLYVEPTQLGPVYRASLCLRSGSVC